MWVLGVGASKCVSILDFGEDMRGDRFVSSIYVSTGYEFKVSLSYGVSYEFSLLVNIVSGSMMS